MPVTLEKASWQQIEPYALLAKGTLLVFSGKTTYYLARVEEVPVGFCGVVWMKSLAKFKNDFVFQQFRGRGYFKEMVRLRLDMVKQAGICRVSACCTPMSVRHYVSVGFTPLRSYKNGCTEVAIKYAHLPV